MFWFQFIPSNALFFFALQQAAALFLPRQHTSGSATCPGNFMGGRLTGCREGQALDIGARKGFAAIAPLARAKFGALVSHRLRLLRR